MTRPVLHIGFWLTYLFLNAYVEIALAGTTFKEFPWLQRTGLGLSVEFLLLPLKVLVTYLVLYRLLPMLYHAKKWWLGIAYLLAALAVAAIGNLLILYGVIYPVLYNEPADFSRVSSGRFIWSFIEVSSVVGLAMGIKYFRLRLQGLEREKQLMEEKLQSELRFLRAQTNPHFLFNVLNSIYALARKKDERTEETVLRLSQLLRFMIYECNSAVVSLRKECQMIKDYLALEELRFQDKVALHYEEDIDSEAYQIPPLLLLPLVENAFKHGVSESRRKGRVKVCLSAQQGVLRFVVQNSVEHSPDTETEKAGLGLISLHRQLDLLYPQRHTLVIEQAEDHFGVDLQVKLVQHE